MKLTDAFVTMLGIGPAPKCPDCGASLNGEGCCDECGYGMEEEEEEDQSEGASLQELLDIKDELQRVLEKVNRLILKSGD